MKMLEIMGYVIDGIIQIIFNWNFYKSLKRSISIPVILPVYVIINTATYLINSYFNIVAVNIWVSLIGIFIISLFYEASWGMRTAGTFLFQTLAIISEMLANGIIVSAGIEDAGKYHTIGLFISKILLFILSICTQVVGKRRNEIPRNYIIIYMFIPLLSVFVLLGMYQAPIPDDKFMYVIAFSMAVINFLSYYLLNSLAKNIIDKKDSERIKAQFDLQQQKYEQLIFSFKRGSGLIHDINKHLTFLHKCLSDNRISEAREYLETIDESFKENYNDIRSGNLVIDALLNNLKNRLDSNCKLEIKVNITAHRITIPDYDMVTVLGNVLDNIVNHLSGNTKEAFVKIEVLERKEKLIIHTINSCLHKDENDVKNDELFHGTGLGTVNEVLLNYGGVMEVSSGPDSFEYSIVIPMEYE